MTRRPLVLASLLFASISYTWAADARLIGGLTDTQEKPVSGAKFRLSVVAGQTTKSFVIEDLLGANPGRPGVPTFL